MTSIVSRSRSQSDIKGMILQTGSQRRDSDSLCIWGRNPLQSQIPEGRVKFGSHWTTFASGPEGIIDLGRIGAYKAVFSTLKGINYIVDPEIHLIWRSLCPSRAVSANVTINLEFTKLNDPSNRILSSHKHSVSSCMHHIFYPSHTIHVGYNEPIPWALTYELDEYQFEDDYKFSRIDVYLRGYHSCNILLSQNKSSELISMMPLDEPTSGTTLNLPRIPNMSMESGKVKYMIHNRRDIDKVRLLVQLNVDVEGLAMTAKLGKVLSKIDNNILDENSEIIQKRMIAGIISNKISN
uniref:Protein 3 n=1 Tax=Asplenium virus 1 TaxID=2977956 RepID=A0A9N6YJ84_9RHAB|nr:TPA_asm: protein 3 [Asplenium virus 1]